MKSCEVTGVPPLPSRRMSLFILCAITVLLPALVGAADISRQQELLDQSRITLEAFATDPGMTESLRDLASEAKALFILPEFWRWGFIVGGAGGDGLLITRDDKTGQWSEPVFYHVGSMNFGAQLGADIAEIIVVVRTEKGLDEFYGSGFKLGAGAGLAMGPMGKGSVHGIGTDMIAYARKKGVFAGIALGGAMITVAGDLNRSYYGRPVEPRDIVEGRVSNPRSSDLRTTASRFIK